MSVTGTYDSIVVGGGFAGAAAARELKHARRSVLLLEARDRLGGRTYTCARDGRRYEMGGANVHWWQGQAFVEVMRYGLSVEQAPWLAHSCFWPSISGQTHGHLTELRGVILDLFGRFFVDARIALPRPFEPLLGSATQSFDELSVRDRLDQMALSSDERVLLAGILAAHGSGATIDIGLLSLIRWYGLHEWSPVQFMDREHYTIVGGVERPHSAMICDADCEVRLESPVARVSSDRDGVTVVTPTGEEHHARTVVLAVPLAVLHDIELPDDVPEGWRRMAREGVASRGVKVSMWTPPGTSSVFALGPEDAPLSYVITEVEEERGTLLVGFGSDATLLDPGDLPAVRAAMDRVAPGVDIVEAHGHDWLGDEFAQGTWGFLRPGQLTGALAELQQPHRGIILAGADVASGWVALICGAIESGIAAGRSALVELEGQSK